MSGLAAAAPRTTSGASARPIPLAPEEGWLTVGLVAALVLSVAWSIGDARWILGRGELTDFLPWAALMGVAWGFLGAKVGWSRPRTYILGAVMGALIVPILIGLVLDPEATPIGGWFRATASSSIEAYLDLAVRHKVLTQQYGHFMLVLGLLLWATGMFASYATFGRHRPLNAVVITGLVLLVDMSLTFNDQLAILVVYTIAALLILIRVHADEERTTWLRRRLGDPASVSALYIRGGSVFAGLAIVGALLLTSTASSNPLAGLWVDTQQSLIDLTQGLKGILPGGGRSRITGVSFGPTAAITGFWSTDTGRALEMDVPPGDRTPYYWRAVAYDSFDGASWTLSDTVGVDVPASSPLLDGTGEAPLDPKARTALTYTVKPLGYRGANVFAPDAPIGIDSPTRLSLVGAGQYLGEIDLAGGVRPYTVQALIRQVGDKTPGALTENRLRAAGEDYPDWVRNLYLGVPPGVVGPDMKALLATITKAAPLDDPYDLAKAAEQYLRSSIFHYQTDVTGVACGDRSVVECFAHYRVGYCQHYASTMTILMRMAGVPARFVEGFLPGQRDPRTGTELILNSNSHAWVEVYFPGYGWVPFDPTGNGVAQLAALPSGAPVASARATSRPSASVQDLKDPHRTSGALVGGTTNPSSSTGGLAYVVVALLLAIVLAALAFAAYRRGPRRVSTPDAIFGSISGLAGRFGWARRPTETVYEYAGSLADALPRVRPELEEVAQAKVEVAYARRVLASERLHELDLAQRRVRVALLGLLFRRRRRPKR